MSIGAHDLARLGEMALDGGPDELAQRWEFITLLTDGATCPSCAAVLDPDAPAEDDDGWHWDTVTWLHVCAPGSPPMRATPAPVIPAT
jgi:hypothetical protein